MIRLAWQAILPGGDFYKLVSFRAEMCYNLTFADSIA
jgi:hypothetical protein